MNQPIIPTNLNCAHTFFSKEIWDKSDTGDWVRSDESDPSLNTQLADFTGRMLAQITFVSPPSLTAFVDKPGNRVYVLAVSILYVPATEGEVDG